MTNTRLVGLAIALGSCVIVGTQGLVAQATLYDRLGGKPAVTAVTSGLVDRILLDSRINAWFAHAGSSPANTAAYKAKLYDFVCEATGGPCKYQGLDMVTAHRGRRVSAAAFDAVVEDLVLVLDSLRVAEKEKKELLGVLAPLKSSIVQP
jgi:hemoglobin